MQLAYLQIGEVTGASPYWLGKLTTILEHAPGVGIMACVPYRISVVRIMQCFVARLHRIREIVHRRRGGCP